MSADNFVGVRPEKDGTYSIFEYGCMSILDEDCMYLKDAKPTKIILPTAGIGSGAVNARALALVEAHDLANKMMICEYGVIELQPVPKKFCGKCWVCVHERKIVDPSVPKCDSCLEPIAGEWMVMTNGGTYHNRCEPGR